MINKIINTALAEVGYLEKKSNSQLYNKTANAGHNNYTKYGYEMHKLHPSVMDYPAAWCDAFVDWCFVKAFGADTAKELLHEFDDYTVNSVYKFRQHCQWSRTPKAGDQIFFTDSKGSICHTGLVISVSNGRVYTVEGNTSGGSTVVANGGSVAKKSYPITYSRIAGYGRPNYKSFSSDLFVDKQALEISQLLQAQNNENKRQNSVITAIGADIEALKKQAAIYNLIDDSLPEWAIPTIKKITDQGLLKGENGILKLNTNITRLLVMLDRAGILK